MHSGEKSLTGEEGVSLLFTAILHLSHCSLCRAVLLNARKDAKVSSAPLCSDKHAECVRIQNWVSNSKPMRFFLMDFLNGAF